VDALELAQIMAGLRSAGAESTSVEVKAAVGGVPKSVRETLSAFSNGTGGTLILGLDEQAGFRPAAGFEAARVRDGLARMCADDLQPPVRADIEVISFEGGHLLVAQVAEVDPLAKPCYVKARGEYQGSFIRGGDGDRKLSEYEVALLHANRGQPKDDREPVPEAGLADLDPDAVDALLRRMRRRQPRAFRSITDEVALRRLAVLVQRPGSSDLVPSLAGLLTLGTYPQQYFPQLNVTFVVFPSGSRDAAPEGGPRFLDNQVLNGPVPDMVADTVDAVTRNMRVAAVIHGIGREDVYDYPVDAVREAVVNAVMHRDYSPQSRGTQVQVEMYPARLVIRNPGGLFGAVSESELGTEGISSSRNPVLSALLQEVQLPDSDRVVCENRGTGIPAMLGQLRRSGTATVEFSNAISHFTTIFTRLDQRLEQAAVTAPATPVLSGRAQDVLALFTGDRSLSAAEVMNAMGLGRAMTLRHLARLVDEGYLDASAPPASRNRTYRLSARRPAGDRPTEEPC
jgi:ATP-dependent DNA helicase RecG